jgi:hypothetical protein
MLLLLLLMLQHPVVNELQLMLLLLLSHGGQLLLVLVVFRNGDLALVDSMLVGIPVDGKGRRRARRRCRGHGERLRRDSGILVDTGLAALVGSGYLLFFGFSVARHFVAEIHLVPPKQFVVPFSPVGIPLWLGIPTGIIVWIRQRTLKPIGL